MTVDEFTLEVSGRTVPGVRWQPEGGADRLVLLGHGGTGHKRMDHITEVAELLVARGMAAVAIDGPGHGDRSPAGDGEPGLDKRWIHGGGTSAVVEDWRATLDHIEATDRPRPTAWWGLSMGTMMGVPVTAADERIRLAVLGLMGFWGPNADDLRAEAPKLSCPLRFLVQWDDELVPRGRPASTCSTRSAPAARRCTPTLGRTPRCRASRWWRRPTTSTALPGVMPPGAVEARPGRSGAISGSGSCRCRGR